MWPFPVDDDFAEDLVSDVADTLQVSTGRVAHKFGRKMTDRVAH